MENSNTKRKKRKDFIYSYTNKTSNISIIKKINPSILKIQIRNKEKIILLILLFSFFLQINCQIINKDSIVTLKVSNSGEQKIFNSGTKPNEIWIDNIQQSINNSYYLEPTNIVKMIWTNDITDCYYMFFGCDSIIEMNFTNFDASKCQNIGAIFKGCISLKSLDLSGFITSNHLYCMCDMFWNCYELKSLKLPIFDTSNVYNIGHMFCNCKSLESIDLSNFKTEKVQYIDNMFNGCIKLTSLNLSSFITSEMVKMDNLFVGCETMKSLDFPNLDVSKVERIENVNNIFLNCKNLEYINLKNLKSNINLESKHFNGTPKNLVVCVDKDKTQLINNTIDNNNCILISCNGKLPDSEYKIYSEKGCFTETCLTTNYKYEFENICYERCPTNSKLRENTKELEGFGLDEKYFCKPICNETFPYEIILTQKCVEDCDLESILNKSCILNYQMDEKKENDKTFDILLKKIEDSLNTDYFDTSKIEEGNNNVINYEHMTVTLTTTKNQKNDEKKGNMTAINLGDCEIKLKEAYNISSNETLFMKKIEVKQEGMLIPKIEFDVYYKLNGEKLVKLNLSYCSNSKIDISIPLKIAGNIDKFNSSSGYYNDICYTTTSDAGTDIILKDRKSEFINNNNAVCQENCFFSEYDYNINIAKCSCDIVESSSLFDNIKIDKSKLFENFIDIKNIANINILVCYKVLFSKKGVMKNYGSYFIILLMFLHLILIIIFYINNFNNKIQSIINKISFGINNLQNLNEKYKKNKNKEDIKKCKYNHININKKKNKMQKMIDKKNEEKIKSNERRQLEEKSNHKIKINDNKKLNLNSFNKELIVYKRDKNNHKIKSNKNLDKMLNKSKKIMSYNDNELNDLEYEFALKCDKRGYCQYYFSLLKSKHALIFTFCNNTDYNSKIIKIDLFIFNFTLFYFVNAIFFTDDTMHKIYKNKGAFDIIGQIPQIIYSSLISMLFSMILEMLALTENIILELKKIKLRHELKTRIKSIGNKIKIKFVLYFIISTIFLISFWYYIAMFCAIYANTQIHLIKDTLLSFFVSLVEPFGIYLIPGLFRIPSLSKNSNRYILYKFSKIIQMILI